MKLKLFLMLMVTSLIGLTGCSDENETISVSEITVNETSMELKVGETATLTATVLPENATDKTIVWSSSDDAVVTVDETGTVTAVGPGTATVSVMAKNGGAKATCEVIVTLKDPVLGDYYFSDGTYASEIDANKEVIGIVFWVGDPTASDPALKREHPECTHGLVVALNEVVTPWQYNWDQYGKDKLVGDWIKSNTEYESIATKTKPEDNMNKIIGYNNTKGIECFNADPSNSEWKVEAVEEVVKYRESHPTPAHTSGWYFPSLKELSLLCTGEWEGTIWDIANETDMRDFIAEKLANVPNAEPFNNVGYWSSSEYAPSSAYYLSITDGAGYNDLRKSYKSNLALRCIFAF